MTKRKRSIAIIGAGLGGLTTAIALRRIGIDIDVFEQASKFSRVGAGIQVGPNAVRVLREFGMEPQIRQAAFQPEFWLNRAWDTGAEKFHFRLGEEVETRYGAPYLLMHRGDLHSALFSKVPPGIVHLNKRLTEIEQGASSVTLHFEDGTRATADAVIGADGVHSRVREILLGPEKPHFTGRVAYRTVFPAALLNGFAIDGYTKWWGEDRHIVIYYINPRKDELYFVTSLPEEDWTIESWSSRGDVRQLQEAFSGFHEHVQRVLAACRDVHKWALVQRQPLSRWSERRVVLLGDSCHPMVPYMAQGGAMAMEDAVVLSRCLEGLEPDAFQEAFKRYENTRKGRTSRVQLNSFLNKWMSKKTNGDWVYNYDAWHVPLESARSLQSAI